MVVGRGRASYGDDGGLSEESRGRRRSVLRIGALCLCSAGLVGGLRCSRPIAAGSTQDVRPEQGVRLQFGQQFQAAVAEKRHLQYDGATFGLDQPGSCCRRLGSSCGASVVFVDKMLQFTAQLQVIPRQNDPDAGRT